MRLVENLGSMFKKVRFKKSPQTALYVASRRNFSKIFFKNFWDYDDDDVDDDP
jgi:hypothetical protein